MYYVTRIHVASMTNGGGVALACLMKTGAQDLDITLLVFAVF
jgi:hypothetical protein